jgi:hypothetical protein
MKHFSVASLTVLYGEISGNSSPAVAAQQKPESSFFVQIPPLEGVDGIPEGMTKKYHDA